MAPQFTTDQQKVIDHREGGLLVSAAAGSGKTTVMVEQIVSMLKDRSSGLTMDKLLVVTFTNAAASSMKAKLEERLLAELEKDEENEHLAEQIRMIPLASVSTNHSFSLQIVKDYITRIEGIDPGFRTAEDMEISLMKADVLGVVLEKAYTKALVPDPDEESRNFMAFVNTYGGTKQDNRLEDLVLGIYSYMLADPDPEMWLENAVNSVDPDYTGENSLQALGIAKSDDPGWNQRVRELFLPAMKGLQKLLLDFHKAFRKEKAEKNVIDFSDYEHFALEILKDESICSALREKYRYIFIDEYQDCNLVQETIIGKIARKNAEGYCTNVIMVGDVKQSIYRFRLADPSLFTTKYAEYGNKPDTELINLNKNFRSSTAVIDSVNDVFKVLMRKELGGIDYGDAEKLYAADHRLEEDATGKVTRFIIQEIKGAESQRAAEAERCGREILSLVQSGQYSFGDIVILLRAFKNPGPVYERTLKKMGIPVQCESGESFFEAPEIRVMMDLLVIIDNPIQDIPLFGVLCSPVAGLSDDDLARVRLAKSDGDLYHALLEYKSKGAPCDTLDKVTRFLKNLDRWRTLAPMMTIHDLLWMLYRESGYYLYASALPAGQQRKANLDLLLSKSIDFEQGSYTGLYQFLRYVKKMEESSKSEKESRGAMEDTHAVRIMTIHKSKGLEFPVVFLGAMGAKINLKEYDNPLVYHDKHGIGGDLKDPARLLKYDKEDVKKSYIKEKGKEESYAEEIRLLYVAMTRAKEQLFLLGGRDAIKEKKNKVDPAAMFDEDGRMKKQSILEKKTYLEWVEAIVSYHKPASISMEVEAAQMPDVPEIEIIPEEKTVGDDAGHEGRITDKMKEKVFWSYPGDWKARIPKVISVSAVKHGRMEQAAEELAEEEGGGLAVSFDPVFRSDKERGASEGALRGTAYHEIMARCDMKDMSTPEGRERQLENILKNGYLTEKELKLVPGEWITLFGESKLCQRICRSPLVVREKDFVVSMTLEELDQLKAGMNYGSDSGESVILQGIIDIFFYEGEDIVLVDYKTDYDLDEKTVEGYKVQLEIYSKALEAATGRKVKEKLLYAVRTGKEIPC